jgi:hypothetical protein
VPEIKAIKKLENKGIFQYGEKASDAGDAENI